ncbi:MAG: metallophosphoesterase [Treponema sp.]|nr:metallophosphoesterase [Candidatus Treponema merdequi]
MNFLYQTKSLLISSEQDVINLSKKESASILVISDSHGSENNLKIILEHFAEECDAIVFCGDGIFEFTSLLENIRKNKKLSKSLSPVIALVRGNGDDNEYAVDFNLSEDENAEKNYILEIPDELNFKAAGMNIFVTHGSVYGVNYGFSELENKAETEKSDLVLYGHTHIADRMDNAGTVFINPGSCSLPRGGFPPSCAVIKLPGDQEKISCTFYERKVSITEGISFIPFFI